MKMATISQTKNNLSVLLDRVRHGETILILDRNRPIARIEPVVAQGSTDPQGRLERLERTGVLRRGTGKPVEEILRKAPPRPRKGGDALAALLEERREGR